MGRWLVWGFSGACCHHCHHLSPQGFFLPADFLDLPPSHKVVESRLGAAWEIIVILHLLKKQRNAVLLPSLVLVSTTLPHLLSPGIPRFRHSVTVLSACVFPIGSVAG